MKIQTRSILIVCLGVLVMIINNGFVVAGLTTFDSSMLQDLGISVTALKIRDTITLIILGVSVPVIGYLIDRVRITPIVVIGLAVMALAFVGYRYVHSALDIYIVHVLLGGSQALCGVVCHVVLISRWTSSNRGLALGTLVAGSSLGNAVIPAFNSWLLASMGWRDAIVAGAVAPLVLIPIVILVYREQPAGFKPVDIVTPKTGLAPNAFQSAYTSRNFQLLAATAALTVFCVLGLSTNLALYVETTLRSSTHTASFYLFLLFIGAVFAQIAAGFAADRVGAGTVHVLAVGLMATGGLMLGTTTSAWAAPAVTLFGIGWGGNSAMLQLRPTRLFAGPAIGRILGALAVVETFGGGLGPSLTGYLYDRTGDYRTSFAVIGAISVLALVSTSLLRTPSTTSRRLAAL